MKMQLFHYIDYDPQSSLKVTKDHLKISKSSFSKKYFCLTPNLLKTFQERPHYKDTTYSYNEV